MDTYTLHNYQIRLTHTNYDAIKDYFDKSEKYMVFKHKPIGNEENEHFHIYLIRSSIARADTIREKLQRSRFSKVDYAVSTTAGRRKEKITEYLAYQYGMAPKSQPVLMESKGISETEFTNWKMKAEMFYDILEQKRKKVEQQSIGPVTVIREVIQRPDKVWERLVADEDKYSEKTIKQIKSMICAEWLNMGKAIPRPSDLHRYATSLYMRQKYKGNEVPDDAMENYF